MFINFWYPALPSAELRTDPVRVRMLGQEFVLARDLSGQVFCLSNVCAHRGGSLANGRLRDGQLECPYHGWRFAGSGLCTRIPSLGIDARVPVRARVDSYPVQERYGLVFAFLGDLPESERPTVMPIPEYDNPGWRCNLMIFDGRCNYERSVENALDTAHTSFVHGFGKAREEREVDFEEHTWGSSFMTSFHDTPGLSAGFAPRAGTGFHGASCFYTIIEGEPGRNTNQYMFELPIDEHHIRIFLVNSRNSRLDPSYDAVLIDSCTRVVRQDLAILESLAPTVPPRGTSREYLVLADKPVRRYREWLAAWERRGWRIDTDRIHANGSRTAFAIPSPARNGGGNWVIEPVPTICPDIAA
jgi:phenylpropionate dioxygenase-like ring-hydroxylating dioxygenase large terminal subunit